MDAKLVVKMVFSDSTERELKLDEKSLSWIRR